MSAIQPPWEAFAYKGILVVQVPDVHDAKRKILLTIAALKSTERWRKAGFRMNAPFPLFQHNAQCKEGAVNKAAASSASPTAQVKSRQVIFFFFFFVAAVYWANLKGAFMTCAARNAPNPQIPRTDKEKNPPPPQKKHCVSSPGVEDFWQPSAAWLHSQGATYHVLKRCSTTVGFSSSFQRVL